MNIPFSIGNNTLRLAENKDSPGICRLIDGVYREYGDKLNTLDADADLLDINQNYFNKGAVFVVLEAGDGTIVASHAVVPGDGGIGTFKRLYLSPPLRGTSWGNILMNWAIDTAKQLNIRKVEFWSDSRFHRAHHYFGRFGFVHDGRVREMNDGSMPYSEKYFSVEMEKSKLVKA